MIARIRGMGSQFVLTVEPEIEAETASVRQFSAALARAHLINCRGFQYMDSKVEFLVQPVPGRD